MILNSIVSHRLSYKSIASFLIISVFLGCPISYAYSSENLNEIKRLNLELLFAVINNDIGAIKHLINNGANVKIKDNFGNTLLHYGGGRVTSTLIEAGADVNARNNFGDTPLHNRNHSLEHRNILALMRAGAKVNVRNYIGKTPLDDYKPYHRHSRGTYDALIRAGALTSSDLFQEERQVELNFELFLAIMKIDIEIASELLVHIPDVNIRDNFGNTLLHYAVKPLHQLNSNSIKRHKNLAEILIAAGVDINTINNAGNTPMDIGYNTKVYNILKEASALTSDELHQQELNLRLLFAVIKDDIEETRYLINNGANVKIKDNFSNTLLHYARGVIVTETLIKAGAEVNARNNIGNTPLHYVHFYLRKSTGKILPLIEAGAEVNAKNNDDETPLTYITALFENAKNGEDNKMLLSHNTTGSF